MKTSLFITIAVTIILFSCHDLVDRKPIGGGFGVVCSCYKDTSVVYYQLGNQYYPFDTAHQIINYYTDSCTKLQHNTGWDSSKVWVYVL